MTFTQTEKAPAGFWRVTHTVGTPISSIIRVQWMRGEPEPREEDGA